MAADPTNYIYVTKLNISDNSVENSSINYNMTEGQKEALARYTCYILDTNADLEEFLDSHAFPEGIKEKMNKAFDLIFEVNQECFTK